MKVIHGFSQSQMRRWAALGLLTATVLAVTVVAGARRTGPPGSFQQVESGINHAQHPFDSHHLCGVGMNSALGHCTVTVALVSTNRGIIEYEFAGGGAIYGTWTATGTKTPDVSVVNIRFTKGTGRFENRANGSASGTLQLGDPALGVRPYTATLHGTFYSPPE